MKQPLKETLKKIGGSHLLNEGIPNKSGKDTVIGFSNEMGALYLSKKGQAGGKSLELYKRDIEEIIKMYKQHRRDMD